MKPHRSVRVALLAAVGLVACGGTTGGDAGAAPVPLDPPSGLSYSAGRAVYVLGTSIAPNSPSSAGGAVDTYSVSPTLPAGLSLHTGTGVIGGTPTAVTPCASYTVTASNASGSTTAVLTLTVSDRSSPPGNLRYATNPAYYTQGAPIPPNTPASDGGIPESWSVSPPLPAGLTLDPVSGTITGTPTAAAIASGFTVTAANAAGSASVVVVIAVTPSTVPSYAVRGTVTGLQGSGLLVQLNAGEVVAIPPGATAFAFPTRLPSGSAYAVSVATQPVSPWQTCRIANGSGSVGGSDVTSVSVDCGTNPYAVGGMVLGLRGSGLVLATPGQAALPVAAGATSFRFPVPVASGSSYAVAVAAQPAGPTQSCSVGAGTGVVYGSDVTGVVVNCATSEFLVGGVVSGLVGDGFVLALHGEPDVSIPAGATSFAFPAAVPSGSPYAVAVRTQPTHPTQTCAVAKANGTVGAGDVTDVAVTCATNAYALAGTITGMSGSGLELTSLGLPAVTVPPGATGFSFGLLPSGTVYNITVSAQPTRPSQSCAVTGGNGAIGSADVPGITVTCATNRYALGGTASGLTGAGLVLSSPGLPDLSVPSGSSSFSFQGGIPSGSSYAVTVKTQPSNPAQTCIVTNGTGTVGTSDVLDLAVTCSTNLYRVGGSVTGLSGYGLVVASPGQPDLKISSTASSFAFDTAVPQGTPYVVTVKAQPEGPFQTCAVTGGAGTVGAADVSTIAIACTTNTYAVRGSVTGLVGTGLQLATPGASPVAVPAGATSYRFPAIPSGTAYAVTVATQPTGPTQTCEVVNASGVVESADVNGVDVTCVTSSYGLAGVVSGLVGTGLRLSSVGLPAVDVPAGATGFGFGSVPSGTVYDVRVAVQPSSPAQTCSVIGGTGVITSGAVSSVLVSCN